MSRSERLLALLQLLRGHRYAITGSELASQLGISLRTLYRDIATLQAQGAHIEGEAGIGYVLRPGFMLPPLMFSEEELDALVLGSRWVAAHADHALSTAASSALAKIEAVLPADYRQQLHANALLIGTARGDSPVDEAPLRSAIRQQRKVTLNYRDLKEASSERTVWPFALGYFDQVRVLVAWCELRQGFRHFRVDRISAMRLEAEPYPGNRERLLKEWRASQQIPQPRFIADRN
ncbi:TPA: YafY family transcriptional regulator [Aeromonas dhakensis]|uniref:helix-turn-helix transcriptional regulator n=1 Tax=Aeromonas TaxID=642 RepID=UPI00036C5BEC|nr:MULTISPECIES: YafY family protein [Aeromonas]MDD9307923.1 YafY family transcriptional regulator [Aeromonas hydrophila]MBF8451720.1 YafY family transcriptional regulator [Aeromonas dhakensis]MBL0602986.1 YafY family transcriptional regulator [Aeromonas dhakensis]MBL0619412.1 YafY family transcriptional regulator [Aeromonas dhakensis]MBL0660471.1 YafY family transcriptional regulator [Aeromonas dhakensis]